MQSTVPQPAPIADGLGNWQVREMVHNSQTTAEHRGRNGEPAPVFAYTPNITNAELNTAPQPLAIEAPKISKHVDEMLTNTHVAMQTQMLNDTEE